MDNITMAKHWHLLTDFNHYLWSFDSWRLNSENQPSKCCVSIDWHSSWIVSIKCLSIVIIKSELLSGTQAFPQNNCARGVEWSSVSIRQDQWQTQTDTRDYRPGCIRGLWVTGLQTSDSLPNSQLSASSQISYPPLTFTLLYKIRLQGKALH